MARIKIEQLPVMEDIEAGELKGIFGGDGMGLGIRPLARTSQVNQARSRIEGSQNAMANQMAGMNTAFLALQTSMQQQSRQFSTVSNIMKTQHDTAKHAIQNMR